MDRDSSEMEDELPALQANPNILKEMKDPDLTMLSEENANHVHTPPAHLAARFYRSSSNRRRSSAASSRRNSLSSTHSHHSTRSLRNSYHSNHVAQQLRRASIIESRKARLADKAAHAEQVRLRAALVKAAPRTSSSEEKFLAAQQTREKLLAKVAAACAEEVARAKKIAEEAKEKRAAEERRCRLEMEEKHAEAEKRRLEYKRTQRKSRSASTVALEGKRAIGEQKEALAQDNASRIIQKAWRQRCRRLWVKDMMQFELTIDRVRDMNFMEASTLLADVQVIACTRKIMAMLHLDVGAADDLTSVRRFLSAYMILGHATDIFNRHGQQEEDLMEKAKELLISFEEVLGGTTLTTSYSASATQMETISQAYASYLTAFEAWKTKDASVLIDTMIDQFVAFDSIWQTVREDTRGMVAHDYREAIRDQQVILLSKIKKLAGADSANKRIKQAIRESRRAKMRQRPTGDLRPRPVTAIDAGSGTAPAEDTAETVDGGLTQSVGQTTDGLELGELSRIFSVVPPNRSLVHELMLDPEFRIEVSPQSDVRSALNREVCDSMRRAIEQGQGDTWTMAVAENIRKRLLKLLKPGNSMHRLLSEVLDPEHVRNQCAQGLFSYEKFFSFMADLLPKLCAPFRDEEVKALGKSLQNTNDSLEAMIEKLFGLLHIIDLMSLDYTNYMLQQAAPTLIREGAAYENRAFTQEVEQGTISLQKTKRWWRHATVSLITESGLNEAPSRATFARIYARGIVDLAVGPDTLQTPDIPETLHLDANRLQRIRVDMLRFTFVGAILLTAKNLLRRDVRSQWKPEAKRVFESIKDGYDDTDRNLTMRVVAIVGSSHGMPQSSRDHLSGVTTRFLDEVRSGRLCDPVLKLLLQRLKTHLFNRLAASSSVERVRAASTASEGLAALGLAEFIGQVGSVTDELAKVASIDQGSHGVWYEQIAEELDRMSTLR